MLNDLNHSLFAEEETLFAECGILFSARFIKKNVAIPFQYHPQFQTLVDILSRKSTHHAILACDFSYLLRANFLSAFSLHLEECHLPQLRSANILYIDVEKALHISEEMLAQYFNQLATKLSEMQHYFLIALSDYRPFISQMVPYYFFQPMQQLLHSSTCRFIVFKNHSISKFNSDDFAQINLIDIQQTDLFTLLKQECSSLQAFHRVLIPDELFEMAYRLSKRYLNETDTLSKTLLLLDSAAARAAQTNAHDPQNTKPVVSLTILQDVVSAWTQIPAAFLQMQHIKMSDFSEQLKQRIFGQDTAIHLLSQHLLQSQTELQKNSGPFAMLHFAGPTHSGKRTTAMTLTEQLFKQLSFLFIAESIAESQSSLFNLKFYRATNKQIFSLADVIHDYPYAVIFLEFKNTISISLQNELFHLANTGVLFDTQGRSYHFHQAIFIVSTTFGNEILSQYAQNLHPEEDQEELDLMQLIATEKKPTTHVTHTYLNNHVIDEIQTGVQKHMPMIANLLPLIPLNPSICASIKTQISANKKMTSPACDGSGTLTYTYDNTQRT